MDLLLQGLIELAAWPAERIWARVRRAAGRRGGIARAAVHALGGLAVACAYLVALAVLAAVFYAIAYVVTA